MGGTPNLNSRNPSTPSRNLNTTGLEKLDESTTLYQQHEPEREDLQRERVKGCMVH